MMKKNSSENHHLTIILYYILFPQGLTNKSESLKNISVVKRCQITLWCCFSVPDMQPGEQKWSCCGLRLSLSENIRDVHKHTG